MKNQIEHQNLSYLVYKQIRIMILEGKLASGQKIIQEKLAKNLGVSRMTLQTAFQRLEDDFLVEHQPRIGFFVKKIDKDELLAAMEYQSVVEGLAARKTAERISPDEVKSLYDIFLPFKKNLKKINKSEYEEADIKFHNMLLMLSNNWLVQKTETTGNFLFLTHQKGLIRDPEETYPEHLAIIDALSAGDGELAEKLIRQHFDKSIKMIYEVVMDSDSSRI